MTGPDTDKRLEFIKKYGTNPYSGLLLYEDMAAFPLTAVEGFIGYRNGHGMLLVMGEPVCAPGNYRMAMQEFIDYCRKEKKAFLQICCEEPYKEAVKDLDLSAVCIGEDFIFDPCTYSPKGRQAEAVRSARNRAIRSGVTVKEYEPRRQPDPSLEAALAAAAGRWMEKARRFAPHLIDLNIFENRACKRYFYAEVEGAPVAMIVCLPIYGQQGYLLEDVIRDPAAPYGCIELITLTVLDCLKINGCKMATFWISPNLEANGHTGTTRGFMKTGMWFADRMFRLHQLYHFREKFHVTCSEPFYALKYPKGFKVIDLVRIISLF